MDRLTAHAPAQHVRGHVQLAVVADEQVLDKQAARCMHTAILPMHDHARRC
jgi:hypothetical protein